jgi:hypothetical protein
MTNRRVLKGLVCFFVIIAVSMVCFVASFANTNSENEMNQKKRILWEGENITSTTIFA